MPIPKPRPDESRSAFITRCMGDDDMNREYRDPADRAGVCASQWERRNAASSNEVLSPVPVVALAYPSCPFPGMRP